MTSAGTLSRRSELPKKPSSALRTWRYAYAFWILAILIVFTVVMWDLLDSGAYYLGLAVGIALMVHARSQLSSVLAMCVLGLLYALNPHLISFMYAGCFIPLGMMVARRKIRASLSMTGAFVVYALISGLLRDDLNAALTTFVFTAVAWAFGAVLQIYNDRIQVETVRAEQAATAAKLEAAEFAKVIAREMHDAVAHSMSSVVLRSRAAALRPDLSAEARADLTEITELSLQSLAEIRALLRLLRGNDTEEARYRDYKVIDPVKELGRLIHHLESQGFTVNHIQEGGFDSMDPLALSTFIACVREASANAVRHGSTEKPIILTINADQTRVSVAFVNTIDETKELLFPSSGLGLMGIRERLDAIGGSVSTSSGSGRWLLTFWLPKRIGIDEQGEG